MPNITLSGKRINPFRARIIFNVAVFYDRIRGVVHSLGVSMSGNRIVMKEGKG